MNDIAKPTTATKPANGGKVRKVPVRIPRTPAEVAMGQCNNILKRIDDATRKCVMRSLVALHGAE